MAEPAPFSNVPTTTDIASKRKLAQALMGQAIDTSPVGHWTQALARVVQGGVGGMNQSAAEQGEKDRQNVLVQELSKSPEFAGLSESSRGLMAQNPEMLQSVAGKVMGNRLDPNAGLQRQLLEAKIKNLQAGGDGPMHIKEWNAYQRMTPDDQQRYLTMKRAEKYLDTGTGFVRPNPVDPTATPAPIVSKNISEKERLEQVGQSQGKAQVSLPDVESNVNNVISYIDAIETDPNLNRIIGQVAGATPNFSTGARTAQSKIDQLNNQGFLIAFERLKGAGAITETEGKAATQALTRLREQVQDPKDYKVALADFKSEVYRLLEVAKRKAGKGGPNGDAGISHPPEAVQMLKSNPTPETRAQFDAVFGPGAADRAMGGR